MDNAWLEMLDEPTRRSVLMAATRRRFRKGDTVFHEGDPGDTLHMIVKGHAAVRVSTALGDVATLTVLGPGESFGELALISGSAVRSASVVTLDALETQALHRDAFEDLCRRQPVVRELLVRILAAQVQRLTERTVEALFVPAEARVVRRLDDLASVYATADPLAPVTIGVTQEDLASMAGTTRPTANRALQDLAAAGVVALGRGRIDVLDRTKLHVLARRA